MEYLIGQLFSRMWAEFEENFVAWAEFWLENVKCTGILGSRNMPINEKSSSKPTPRILCTLEK